MALGAKRKVHDHARLRAAAAALEARDEPGAGASESSCVLRLSCHTGMTTVDTNYPMSVQN